MSGLLNVGTAPAVIDDNILIIKVNTIRYRARREYIEVILLLSL